MDRLQLRRICAAPRTPSFPFCSSAPTLRMPTVGLAKPTVGILNVGAEEQKGNDGVRGAAQILRNCNLSMAFHGFVEGDDIAKGTVDVVVTGGFTGNIALKTAEGTARLVGSYLRQSLKRGLMSRIGAVIASGALNTLRR